MQNNNFKLDRKRVWVAGHQGMVGSALVRRLKSESISEILTVDRKLVDLRRQVDVEDWFMRERPDVIFLAAAKVGGIWANDTYPADFLYDNLMIEANIIHASAKIGVDKLLFLGSSCIYPRLAPQPIKEGYLLSGPLEPTNEWYALAKIAGIKLCQAYRKQYGCDFISAMPTNLYGPGDNYDLQTSHVIPALLRKAHEAKAASSQEMVVWGTGKPRREFLHVDDLADALVFLLTRYSGYEHVNIGCGNDISIAELADAICDVVGFSGKLVFDSTKPDGTPRKLLDVSVLEEMGWNPRISLGEGLRGAYEDFMNKLGL